MIDEIMKFAINHKGTIQKYSAKDWASFESDLLEIQGWILNNYSQELDFEFMVEGKVVSLKEAFESANQVWEELKAKRLEKKKQIWVRKQGTQGNFKNNFLQIWVNK